MIDWIITALIIVQLLTLGALQSTATHFQIHTAEREQGITFTF